MPKRLIFTVTNDLATDQRMIRICSSLAAEYEVILVGRSLPDSAPLKERSFRQIRLNCFAKKGKFFYLEYNIRLLLFLIFQNADAYCAIDLDTILPNMIVAKINGKKLVYDAHEYFPYVPEVIERPMVQKMWLWIERFAMPKVDLCYTVSQSIATVFEQAYKIPVHTIRNVPFERPISQINKTEKKIVYQGALNEGRGLEQLLEACVGNSWQLEIFGDGDIAAKLKMMVADLKLENQVMFRGKLDPDFLWQETQKAYIGINLAEDKSLSYRFSLSNKLFDYIQAGIPQVAIDFPEFRRINDQKAYGILISSLKKQDISAAINELLNNEDLYKQLVNNCLALRTELCWEKESKILVKLYHELFR